MDRYTVVELLHGPSHICGANELSHECGFNVVDMMDFQTVFYTTEGLMELLLPIFSRLRCGAKGPSPDCGPYEHLNGFGPL